MYRIYQHFGALSIAWNADVTALLDVEGIGLQTAWAIAKARPSINVERYFEEHLQQNPHLWTPADADYPRLLLEMPDPPPLLYYRGRLEPGENQGIIPAIAIVGTRRPTDYGKRWTRRIAQTLAKAGFTIVSGLAEGVDAEAHRSCLEQNGRTIAVVGTGVNLIYPWSNRSLAKDIAEHGLIISEYPVNTKPDRSHFPRRNRIIAGLCRSVLVLEAPLQSGSLITARLATDYNRDVYALPGSLDNSSSLGCLKLIHDGAHMILGEESLLEMLGAMPPMWISSQNAARSMPPSSEIQATQAEISRQPPPSLSPDLERVFQIIASDPISLDFIVEGSELPTGIVLGALAQLELMGLVTQLPGMLYQRC